MFPTFFVPKNPGIVTPDTYIKVYVDGSASMASSFAAIQSAVTTLLKPELLPYYNNDSGWYDSHVTAVQTDNSNDPGERGLAYLANSTTAPPLAKGVSPGGTNQVIIWISDETTPYGAGNGDTFTSGTARTATYNTDIAMLRDYLDDQAAGYYKGGFIHVKYNLETAYKTFVQTILAGNGNYAAPYGLNDYSSAFAAVYDYESNQTDAYYLGAITDVLNALGFSW